MLRRIAHKVVVLAIMGAVMALATVLPRAALAADSGPRFRADGVDADLYGRLKNYPACVGLAYINDLSCRVGAFSHLDKLFPAHRIAAPRQSSALRRAAAEPVIHYRFDGQDRTLDQYLEHNPVTGFLIAKGDTILVERYQYGRTDKQRLTSYSMAKTVVGLLVGIAVADGAIKSIDDTAETYVPGLRGTEYGRTPIKALLQMTSGVSFNEDYFDQASDAYTLGRLTIGREEPGGSLAAVKRFNTRYAPPGRRFSYSSAETSVLGLVLAGATKRTLADYATEKLWMPLGAEADASWAVDAAGNEVAFAYFNAVLRDWARLGLMLANDGVWQGRSVVPRGWILASTTIQPGSPFWTPALAQGGPAPGYGYQVWLLPTKRRSFALKGLRGQYVMVDPGSKLVLVQTAIRDDPMVRAEIYALWSALIAELR
jgi:CubicO group peptidase (beta-lactamase class C family)